tara:strand:+ start:823 stop:1173 length:351 start_codon:yes stop_codon:yes gene_type:complete
MSKVTKIECLNKIKRIYLDNDYIIFDAPSIAFNDWDIKEGSILTVDIYTEKPFLKKTKNNRLELFGYIFKTFEDYSFFSAGGFLAKLSNFYTMDSKLYIVITDNVISNPMSKRSKT